MKKIPENINNAIQEFVLGINTILGDRVKRIILYGSYARGDFNKNSDIDIMILTDLTDDEIVKFRGKIWDFAYDIEYNNNFDIEISPLLKNINDFINYSDCVPFCINVEKEGIDL